MDPEVSTVAAMSHAVPGRSGAQARKPARARQKPSLSPEEQTRIVWTTINPASCTASSAEDGGAGGFAIAHGPPSTRDAAQLAAELVATRAHMAEVVAAREAAHEALHSHALSPEDILAPALACGGFELGGAGERASASREELLAALSREQERV